MPAAERRLRSSGHAVPRPRPAGRAASGFTLLEVLVALAILGLVIIALLEIAGTSLAALASRDRAIRLALAADAVMRTAKLDPEGEVEPEDVLLPDGMSFSVDWTPLAELDDPQALLEALEGVERVPQRLLDETRRLEVEVEDADGRSFRLSTFVTSADEASESGLEADDADDGLLEDDGAVPLEDDDAVPLGDDGEP